MNSGAKKIPDYLRAVPSIEATDLDSNRDDRQAQLAGSDGDPPAPVDPGARKFAAKRHNEHIKSAYSLCNTVCAGIFGAAYILPVIGGKDGPPELDRPMWIGFALFVGGLGHFLIWMGTKREE